MIKAIILACALLPPTNLPATLACSQVTSATNREFASYSACQEYVDQILAKVDEQVNNKDDKVFVFCQEMNRGYVHCLDLQKQGYSIMCVP